MQAAHCPQLEPIAANIARPLMPFGHALPVVLAAAAQYNRRWLDAGRSGRGGVGWVVPAGRQQKPFDMGELILEIVFGTLCAFFGALVGVLYPPQESILGTGSKTSTRSFCRRGPYMDCSLCNDKNLYHTHSHFGAGTDGRGQLCRLSCRRQHMPQVPRR